MNPDTLAQPEPRAEQDRPPRCILIIDDDESQVSALAKRLEKQGYGTRAAHRGDRGREIAERDRPELVILDLRLPDVDGLELCEQLSDAPETCGIPIIILTGMERPDIVRCSRAAGCTYFVRKPYDPNALLTLIEHSIRTADNNDW